MHPVRPGLLLPQACPHGIAQSSELQLGRPHGSHGAPRAPNSRAWPEASPCSRPSSCLLAPARSCSPFPWPPRLSSLRTAAASTEFQTSAASSPLPRCGLSVRARPAEVPSVRALPSSQLSLCSFATAAARVLSSVFLARPRRSAFCLFVLAPASTASSRRLLLRRRQATSCIGSMARLARHHVVPVVTFLIVFGSCCAV